jgi:hypothetical protein
MRKSFWQAALAWLVPTFPLGLASMVVQALVFAWASPRLFPPARTPWWRGALAFAGIFGTLSRHGDTAVTTASAAST